MISLIKFYADNIDHRLSQLRYELNQYRAYSNMLVVWNSLHAHSGLAYQRLVHHMSIARHCVACKLPRARATICIVKFWTAITESALSHSCHETVLISIGNVTQIRAKDLGQEQLYADDSRQSYVTEIDEDAATDRYWHLFHVFP